MHPNDHEQRQLDQQSGHGLARVERSHNARRPFVMRVRPLFAWYDLWIGAFWDRKTRKLYILPLPCIGIVIEFTQPTFVDADR